MTGRERLAAITLFLLILVGVMWPTFHAHRENPCTSWDDGYYQCPTSDPAPVVRV